MKKIIAYVLVAILAGVITMPFPLYWCTECSSSAGDKVNRSMENVVTFPLSLIHIGLIAILGLALAYGVFIYFKRRFV